MRPGQAQWQPLRRHRLPAVEAARAGRGSAQWTLTVALLGGAVATPVLGRLGAGRTGGPRSGFNYVVRSVGCSLGGAIGGLIVATGTGPGHLFPDDSACTTAALVGIGAMAITTLTSPALARRRPSEANS